MINRVEYDERKNKFKVDDGQRCKRAVCGATLSPSIVADGHDFCSETCAWLVLMSKPGTIVLDEPDDVEDEE